MAIRYQKNEIIRLFSFFDYHQTIHFVAEVVHQQNHPPEMIVSYNRCQVKFSTHRVGGITDNDFICAVKLDYEATKAVNQ